MEFLSSDLRKFYASFALRIFGLGLITLFVPAFLYTELHFSIRKILVYFFVQEGLTALLVFGAAHFIARFGARAAMLASIPFSLLTFAFLPLANNPLFLVLAALCRALLTALYWPAFHVFLGRTARNKRVGDSTGKAWFWHRVASVTSPVFGGILLQYAGYEWVFICLTAFQLASVFILPDFPMAEIKPNFSAVLKRVPWRERLSWASQGMTSEAGDILWPLHAFFIAGSYVVLGVLEFLGDGAVAVVSLWAGKTTDAFKRQLVLRFAWLAGSGAWLYRAFAAGPLGVLVGNFGGGSAFLIMETSIMYDVYSKGVSENDLVARVAVREFFFRVLILPLFLLAAFLPLTMVFLVLAVYFVILTWLGKN